VSRVCLVPNSHHWLTIFSLGKSILNCSTAGSIHYSGEDYPKNPSTYSHTCNIANCWWKLSSCGGHCLCACCCCCVVEDGVREEKKWSGAAVEGESRAHSCEQLLCYLYLHTDSGAQSVHYNWAISSGNKDNRKASKSVSTLFSCGHSKMTGSVVIVNENEI